MNKKAYLILLVLLVIGIIFFGGRKGKYAKYHEAAIHGKIQNIHHFGKDFRFSVNGEEYSILPNNYSFIYEIKNGDGVSKKANNDTLIIGHEDEIIHIIAQKK